MSPPKQLFASRFSMVACLAVAATVTLSDARVALASPAVRPPSGAQLALGEAEELAAAHPSMPEDTVGGFSVAAPSGNTTVGPAPEVTPALSKAPADEIVSEASSEAAAPVTVVTDAGADGPAVARAPSSAVEIAPSDAGDAGPHPEASAMPDELSRPATAAEHAGAASTPRASQNGAGAHTSATDDTAATNSSLANGSADLGTTEALAPESGGHRGAAGAQTPSGGVSPVTPLAVVAAQVASGDDVVATPEEATSALPHEISSPVPHGAPVIGTWSAPVSPRIAELAPLLVIVPETLRATDGAGWLLRKPPLALRCSLIAAACAAAQGRPAVLAVLPDGIRGLMLRAVVHAATPRHAPASARATAWPPAPPHEIWRRHGMAAENDGQNRSPQVSPSRELYETTFVPLERGAHIPGVTAAAPGVPFRTDAGDSERRPDELPPGGTMSGTAANAAAQAPLGASSSALALIVALALAAPYLLTTLELAAAQRRPLLLGPQFERPG